MVRINKIVSGGQTGVDQAALQVGLDLNISIGGWCPPGKICDDGLIPERFKLTETLNERSMSAPHIARSERTELNVRDSDGTLILNLIGNDLGTQWTVESAKKYNKPYLILSLKSENVVSEIKDWIENKNITVLNVAGPSEKTLPGSYQKTYSILHSLLQQ